MSAVAEGTVATIVDAILSPIASWDYPGAALVVIVLVFAWLLTVWHTDDTQFDLRCIIVEDATGRVSLHKLGQFAALVISSVALWYEMVHGRLTDWLFTGYMMSWTGASLMKRWIDRQPVVQPIPTDRLTNKEP